MRSVNRVISEVRNVEIDRRSVPQDQLDLRDRRRTSVFPWRGQFSPQFVELQLRLFRAGSVADPFMGSGTTLFEATRFGVSSFGADINPVAVAFAQVATLAKLPQQERSGIVQELYTKCAVLLGDSSGLFASTSNNLAIEPSQFSVILEQLSPAARALAIPAFLLAAGDSATVAVPSLSRQLKEIRTTLLSLPHAAAECHAEQSDARRLGLETGSVDLVLTSPPYINVFNYHQNYRKAAELLGWFPLGVAQSEFGANRKHRANRLLTVIQYCLDMREALVEMRRILMAGGHAVVVVGRESNVRGVPFENGQILAALAVGVTGFELRRWQERSFVSRFGGRIFEDILTFMASGDALPTTGGMAFARQVGILALESARGRSEDASVARDIDAAILAAERIEPSPVFLNADGIR